jgi:hypothetical protein
LKSPAHSKMKSMHRNPHAGVTNTSATDSVVIFIGRRVGDRKLEIQKTGKPVRAVGEMLLADDASAGIPFGSSRGAPAELHSLERRWWWTARLGALAVVFTLLFADPLPGQWIAAADEAGRLGVAEGPGVTPGVGAAPGLSAAQGFTGTPDFAPLLHPGIGGLRLERVVLFQSYSSRALPGAYLSAAAAGLGAELESGGSATFAFRHAGRHSDFALLYTPRFVARRRHPEWSHASHDFQLDAGRQFRKQRWSLDLRTQASLQEYEQFAFEPGVLRNVPNPPVTLEDLVQQAADGRLSSEELASVLTGAPIVESHDRFEQDFPQVLQGGLSAGATYDRTPRMAVRFGVSGAWRQFVSGHRLSRDETDLFIPATATAETHASIDYRLSRRSILSAEVSVRRSLAQVAALPGASYLTETVALERKIGRKWMARVRGGSGAIQQSGPSGSAVGLARHSWVAGAGLEYRGDEHSWRVAADRTVGDSFGLPSRSRVAANASWRWQKPGRRWSLRAAAGHAQAKLIGLQNYSSRSAHLALVRQISRHTTATTSYSWISYSSAFRGVFGNMSRSQVQVSLSWTPGFSR